MLEIQARAHFKKIDDDVRPRNNSNNKFCKELRLVVIKENFWTKLLIKSLVNETSVSAVPLPAGLR